MQATECDGTSLGPYGFVSHMALEASDLSTRSFYLEDSSVGLRMEN